MKIAAYFRLGHHPLIWWVLPCLLGTSLTYAFPHYLGAPLLLGVGSLAMLSAVLSLFFKKNGAWALSYCLSVFCFCGVFLHKRFPCIPKSLLAPKEYTAEWTVLRVFGQKNSFGRSSLVARSSGPEGLCAYLSLPEQQQALVPSEHFVLTGVLEPLEANPSFHTYLHSIGVHYRLRHAHDLYTTYPGDALQHKRHILTKKWETHLQRTWAFADYRALYASMILGNRGHPLAKELKDRLGLSGCLHLSAVSGLHVGIFASLLLWSLRSFPASRGLAAPLVFSYVWLTGLAPSALRAFLMLMVFWLAQKTLRQAQPLSALLASVMIAFFIEPQALLSAGFQLSHAVVAGFFLLGVPCGRYWQDHLRFSGFLSTPLNGLISAGCLSLSATLLSAPILLMHFQKLSLISPLVNLFAVPIGSLTLICAWISTLAYFPGPLFNTLGCCLLWVMDGLLKALSPITQALSISSQAPKLVLAGVWWLILIALLFRGALGVDAASGK